MSEHTDDEMKAMLKGWRPPDAPLEAKSELAPASGVVMPCPFCGSTKITVEWEPCERLDNTDTNRRWFAECTQCSCQGPFCQKEPQVIPAWNKRVPLSPNTDSATGGSIERKP